MAAFNSHIEGRIEVIDAHFGEGYRGEVPDAAALRGKDAHEQLVALGRTLPYSGFDVVLEMAANHVAVFLNFFFWEREDFTADGLDATARDEVLETLKRAWAASESHGAIPLGVAHTTTTATSSG